MVKVVYMIRMIWMLEKNYNVVLLKFFDILNKF